MNCGSRSVAEGERQGPEAGHAMNNGSQLHWAERKWSPCEQPALSGLRQGTCAVGRDG